MVNVTTPYSQTTDNTYGAIRTNCNHGYRRKLIWDYGESGSRTGLRNLRS